MTRVLLLLFFLLPIPLFSSCRSESHNYAEVFGTVTLENKPLSRGSIQFVPVNDGYDGGGTIINGKFTAKVPLGECKVNINGDLFTETDEKGNPIGAKTVSDGTFEQIIEPKPLHTVPNRYWFDTPLRATVTKYKGETFDFSLELK
jgi:hypothetical protein